MIKIDCLTVPHLPKMCLPRKSTTFDDFYIWSNVCIRQSYNIIKYTVSLCGGD